MRHLLGPAAFVLAIVVGIGVTQLVKSRRPAPPPEPPPPPSPVAPVPQPPEVGPRVSAKVRQLTLDRAKRQAAATLELATEPGAAPPDSAWVTVYFIAPATKRVLPSEPVRVKWPRSGSTANVTVPASWVGTAADPGDGYFARVVVTAGPKPAVAPADTIDTSPTDATPVLVLGGESQHR